MLKHTLLAIAMVTMLGSAGNVAAHDSALLKDLVTRYETLASQVKRLMAESGRFLADVATKQDAMDCLYQVGNDLYVDGCNLHVQDGTGASISDRSETAAINGLGNLIVGYNEEGGVSAEKTGSHNVIVGPYHSYTNQNGLVTGVANTITGRGAAVTGGEYNIASGHYSSVSGGLVNEAGGNFSTVSGGSYNEARQTGSSVSGGVENVASGHYSSVSGGESNEASGDYSSVGGGLENVAEDTYETLP